MEYATKHGYNEIVAETAPLLLETPLSEIVAKLPGHLVVPWVSHRPLYPERNKVERFGHILQVLYHESWSQVLHQATSFHKRWTNVDNKSNNYGQKWRECKHCSCNLDVLVFEVTERMRDPQTFKALDLVFPPELGCDHSKEMIQAWRVSVEQGVKGIKPFFKYL